MDMTKENLKKLVLEKTTLKEDDFDKVISQAEEWVKAREIPKEKQEEYVLRRAYASFKKRLLSPAIKFQGVVLGDMGITDYGAAKKKAEILEKFEKSDEKGRETMIASGLINNKGEPLYDSGFRKGQVINPEEAQNRNLLVFCKKEKADGKMKFGTMRLNTNIDMKVPLLKPVQFLANISDRSTNEKWQLNESDVTEFVVDEKEAEKFDFEQFIEKFLSEKVIMHKKSLFKYHAENETDYDRFCIIKGDVVRVRKTASSLLVVLTMGSSELKAEPEVVDCWLNRPFEVDEMMMDVYIIGRTNLVMRDENEEIVMNGYALWSAYDVVEPEEIKE